MHRYTPCVIENRRGVIGLQRCQPRLHGHPERLGHFFVWDRRVIRTGVRLEIPGEVGDEGIGLLAPEVVKSLDAGVHSRSFENWPQPSAAGRRRSITRTVAR